ncbi:MAG TPA: endonuclease/exonuclease/phosphatase family protein, partial [Blastocatellia bacterium]|nr:endonuclease/exonuclease/phosphatase family protein [Blastocatellia bacterium]
AKKKAMLRLLRDLFRKLIVMTLVADVVFSIAGFFGLLHRYCELASHFRLQYLIAACLCVLFFAIFKAWRQVIVAMVCVVVNAWVVIPWLLLSASDRVNPSQPDLRLMSANLLYRNWNHDALLELVKKENPDVLVVQEASEHWQEALKALDQIYPYTRFAQKSDRESLMLFSRYALADLPIKNESEADFGHLRVVLNFNGKTVSLIGLHPTTPVGDKDFRARNRQFTVVASMVRELSQPVVVIGDFNSTMWSPYFARFVEETKLVSARKGFGILPTFPTFFPLLMIPIDHCLVSPDIKVLDCRKGSNIGSDHLPLIVDLALGK